MFEEFVKVSEGPDGKGNIVSTYTVTVPEAEHSARLASRKLSLEQAVFEAQVRLDVFMAETKGV